MPVIRSAKKAMRQSAKRKNRNYETRSKVKTAIKNIFKILQTGKKDEAEKMLQKAYSQIDKALKKNIIHRNTAARKKSRLAKAISKFQAPSPSTIPKKSQRPS